MSTTETTPQRVLIFDFDGTIADTLNFIFDISNRLANEFQFNRISQADLEHLKDNTLQQTIDYLQVPILKIPQILQKARRELQKEMRSIKPFEGLKEILCQLNNLGYTMGILTSNSRKNVLLFLQNNNLEFFDFVNSTSKVLGKSISLKRLQRQLDLSLNNILYIADEARDILAAQKAGVKVVAVTWGYNSGKLLEKHQPDFIINHPNELFSICLKI